MVKGNGQFFQRREVTNELISNLFGNIFVDMLEKKVSSAMSKLADNTSLHRAAMRTTTYEEIKKGPAKLSKQ